MFRHTSPSELSSEESEMLQRAIRGFEQNLDIYICDIRLSRKDVCAKPGATIERAICSVTFRDFEPRLTVEIDSKFDDQMEAVGSTWTVVEHHEDATSKGFTIDADIPAAQNAIRDTLIAAEQLQLHGLDTYGAQALARIRDYPQRLDSISTEEELFQMLASNTRRFKRPTPADQPKG